MEAMMQYSLRRSSGGSDLGLSAGGPICLRLWGWLSSSHPNTLTEITGMLLHDSEMCTSSYQIILRTDF